MAAINALPQGGGSGKISGMIAEALGGIEHDLTSIAFELKMENLIPVEDLDTVIINTIDSASAVNIISGAYANGKVYI
jgi:hypothetical protein